MAAPASGVDPPTLPPRGNKRKKGRKLRSRAEGGRSACRGATRTRRRTRERGGGVDGGGYPRGKQFLLIQRSHPHGGASLVDPLLDFSLSHPVSLAPFLYRSHAGILFLSPLSVSQRANLASANKCSFACHPRRLSVVFFPPPPFLSFPPPCERCVSFEMRRSICAGRLSRTIQIDRSFRTRVALVSDSSYSGLRTVVCPDGTQLTRFPLINSPGLSFPREEYSLCEISLFACIFVSPFTLSSMSR